MVGNPGVGSWQLAVEMERKERSERSLESRIRAAEECVCVHTHVRCVCGVRVGRKTCATFY